MHENKVFVTNYHIQEGASYTGEIDTIPAIQGTFGTGLIEVQHGQGTQVYPDGMEYDGQWVRGARQGQGVLTFKSGDIYRGHFNDNELNG